jgi:hypothetical protein
LSAAALFGGFVDKTMKTETDYIMFGGVRYEWTGEIRQPLDGEHYMTHGGHPCVQCAVVHATGERAILKQVDDDARGELKTGSCGSPSFVSCAIPGGKVEEISATQEIHCCGPSSEIGEMRIRIMDGGGGGYLVIDATEWAFSDEMEIRAFAESLCAMLSPISQNTIGEARADSATQPNQKGN